MLKCFYYAEGRACSPLVPLSVRLREQALSRADFNAESGGRPFFPQRWIASDLAQYQRPQLRQRRKVVSSHHERWKQGHSRTFMNHLNVALRVSSRSCRFRAPWPHALVIEHRYISALNAILI